jgi:hypothetical protein
MDPVSPQPDHDEHSNSHREEDSNSQRAALIGLLICLLLVLGGLFLVHELRKMSNIQDCVMQGRTNCSPVD